MAAYVTLSVFFRVVPMCRKSVIKSQNKVVLQGVVLDCMHGSSTHGMCSTSGLVHSLTDLYSLKNEELFQIAPMDGPRVGGFRLVDLCICGPTHRALKIRSRSGLNFFFNKKILVLLTASVERFGFSRMREFFLKVWLLFSS